LAYQNQVKTVREFFRDAYPGHTAKYKAVRKLFEPSLRVVELKPGLEGKGPFYTLYGEFESMLNHNAVMLAAEAALFAHPFYELRAGDGLAPVDALPEKPPYANLGGGFSQYPGRAALQKALLLVDLALAQQSMLSGDALLYPLDEAVRGADSGRRKKGIEVLKAHPLIARNYALFVLKRGAPLLAGNVAYRIAFDSQDRSYMSGIASGYEYVHEQDAKGIQCAGGFDIVPRGWSMKLDECLYIPLPRPEKFQAALLEFTTPFVQLISVRKRLVEALVGYDFSDMIATQDGAHKPKVDDQLWEYAVLNVLF
jgi:hypothetical protein